MMCNFDPSVSWCEHTSAVQCPKSGAARRLWVKTCATILLLLTATKCWPMYPYSQASLFIRSSPHSQWNEFPIPNPRWRMRIADDMAHYDARYSQGTEAPNLFTTEISPQSKRMNLCMKSVWVNCKFLLLSDVYRPTKARCYMCWSIFNFGVVTCVYQTSHWQIPELTCDLYSSMISSWTLLVMKTWTHYGRPIEYGRPLYFMVALCNRETIYIFMLWFVLLFFFLA